MTFLAFYHAYTIVILCFKYSTLVEEESGKEDLNLFRFVNISVYCLFRGELDEFVYISFFCFVRRFVLLMYFRLLPTDSIDKKKKSVYTRFPTELYI